MTHGGLSAVGVQELNALGAAGLKIIIILVVPTGTETCRGAAGSRVMASFYLY